MGGNLIVDLSSILGETGSTMDVDDDVPLESMTVGDVEVDFPAFPRIRVTITNVGEVILLTGSVQATARLECARCLEPFDFPLTGAIDAVISVTDDADQRGEEQEWYPLDGEVVDLLPAAESALRVEVPFAPVHDEECRGICPTCGCDLNRDTCTCERQAEGSENPFASLKELLPPEND
jgi:uncharacterized protein